MQDEKTQQLADLIYSISLQADKLLESLNGKEIKEVIMTVTACIAHVGVQENIDVDTILDGVKAFYKIYKRKNDEYEAKR